MDKYREERNGNLITIWDDKVGVGLQFTKDETLQRYCANILVNDSSILATQKGVNAVSRAQNDITEYAAKLYPKEFEPLKDIQQ